MPRPLLRLVVTNRPEQTFPAFWERYPRREAKKDATKAWVELDPSDALVATILEALEWQSHLWVVIEKRQSNHIPLGASYLRAERWTDERPASLAGWKRQQLDQQQAAVDEQMAIAKRYEELMGQGMTRSDARQVIQQEKGGAE